MALTPKSPAGYLAYVVTVVLFVLAYHQVVDHALSRQHALIAKVVGEYCQSAIVAEHRTHDGRARTAAREAMATEWAQCGDIRIQSVAGSGGIANPVVVRVVLDSDHYLPSGKSVLVFKTIDWALPFVSSLSRLASGEWTFNPHTTYSDLTFYGAI